MVPIRIELANRVNYGGKRMAPVEWIVMHYTANDGDSSAANASYFQRPLDPVASAHYFVDDREIVQSVPEDYVAYHCGAKQYFHPTCRNANSIGVELCDTVRNGTVMATERTLDNAAQLVSRLLKKYGLGTERVITHYDVTHKLCPAYWVQDRSGFEKFLNRVQEVEEVTEKSYVLVNDRKVDVERILKDGKNYIWIRSIADALGYDVSNRGNIAVLREKENK